MDQRTRGKEACESDRLGQGAVARLVWLREEIRGAVEKIVWRGNSERNGHGSVGWAGGNWLGSSGIVMRVRER